LTVPNLEAGLVVALALIREAISFSIIAGVDPKVSLYASCSISMIIVFADGRAAMTVMVGFVNALAILIFLAQMPYLLGGGTAGWAVTGELYFASTNELVHAVVAKFAARGVTCEPVGLNDQSEALHTRLTGQLARTIRWYEEVGLVPPSARTSGGFRLHTDADIERLELVEPLDFTLEEMRDLLTTGDRLDDPGTPAAERSALRERLVMYRELADRRVAALRTQLATAELFAQSLADRVPATRGTGRSR
jgi:MerR family copper efflux transcriptional regulator